jgi:hypothetical protein
MELRRLADRNKRITLDTFYEFSAIVDGSGCLKEAVFAIILIPVLEGEVWFLLAILCAKLHRQQVVNPGCASFSIVSFFNAQNPICC